MTVGSGLAPDLLDPSSRKALAGSRLAPHTAGREFHPAL